MLGAIVLLGPSCAQVEGARDAPTCIHVSGAKRVVVLPSHVMKQDYIRLNGINEQALHCSGERMQRC